MVDFADNLQNFVTNMGGDNDKAMHSFFVRLLLDKTSLDAVYTSGGVGGKIVDCVPEDCGRKWRRMTIPEQDPKPFLDLENELGVSSAFVEANRWARLYGGAVILIDIEGDDPTEPLDVKTVSPNKPVTGLIVRDKFDIAPGLLDKRTMRADYYTDLTDGVKWHESRVIGPFFGAPLPRQLRESNRGWGESILARPYRSLLNECTTAQEIGALIHEAHVDVVGVDDLSMYLDGGTRQQKFEDRYRLGKTLSSNHNVFIYDKSSETWETRGTGAALSGLAPLLEKNAARIAAEVDIPMSRLYGKLASGLTTSADVNADDYHAMVSGHQHTRYTPGLSVLDPLLCLSVYGSVPDGLTYEWVPLGEPTAKERAETLKILAEAMEKLHRIGAITPAHVAEYLASDPTFDIGEEYLEYLRERDGLDGGPPKLPLEEPDNGDQ
jgi:phage-related protein (TIGR01555 family)